MSEVGKFDPNLTEKYRKVGFESINEHLVQVAVDDISVGDKQVNVETLPGSSKGGLTHTMKAVAKETHKPVVAEFNGQMVTVLPKH